MKRFLLISGCISLGFVLGAWWASRKFKVQVNDTDDVIDQAFSGKITKKNGTILLLIGFLFLSACTSIRPLPGGGHCPTNKNIIV